MFLHLFTSFECSIPFFGLNSTVESLEINSNLILKSGNELMLRSVIDAKFDALEFYYDYKFCIIISTLIFMYY